MRENERKKIKYGEGQWRVGDKADRRSFQKMGEEKGDLNEKKLKITQQGRGRRREEEIIIKLTNKGVGGEGEWAKSLVR